MGAQPVSASGDDNHPADIFGHPIAVNEQRGRVNPGGVGEGVPGHVGHNGAVNQEEISGK
jgi:hypothetical protein